MRSGSYTVPLCLHPRSLTPIHLPKSAFWSSILAIKPSFTDNCSYQICAGNTNILSHPWCPIWEHMHDLIIYPNEVQPLPNIVSDLWIPGTLQWDAHKIEQVFGQQAALTILQIMVTHSDQDDILCWNPASSGKCTTKKPYKLLAIQRHQSIPLTGSRALPQEILKLLQVIWKTKTLQPKMFAWRLLRQALATGERAGKYSLRIDQNCKR